MAEAIRITKTTDTKDQAQGRGAGFRPDLHRPHVRGRLPGGKGLVRPAHRALRAPRDGPGGRRAPLCPGCVRRAQGLPGRGRQGAPLPSAEEHRAPEQLGPAHVHPAARSRSGAAVHREPGGRRAGVGAADHRDVAVHPPDDHRERAVPGRAPGQVLHLLRDPLAGGRLLPRGHGAGEDPGRREVRARRRGRPGFSQDGSQLCREPHGGRRGQACGLHPGACASTASTASTSTRSVP